MFGIGYCCDTAVTPFGFDLLWKPTVKRIEPRTIILAIMVETLKKIFDWWVFCLIADQYDGITFEQVPDEVGRPSL
ncbi:hypothetical protein D3C87_1758820 [compost metagenome]